MSDTPAHPAATEPETAGAGDEDQSMPLISLESYPAWGEPKASTQSVGHSFAQGYLQGTSSDNLQQPLQPMDMDIDFTSISLPYSNSIQVCNEWHQSSECREGLAAPLTPTPAFPHPVPSPPPNSTLDTTGTSPDIKSQQSPRSVIVTSGMSYRNALVNGTKECRAAALQAKVRRIVDSPTPPTWESMDSHPAKKHIQPVAPPDFAVELLLQSKDFPGGWSQSMNETSLLSSKARKDPSTPLKGEQPHLIARMTDDSNVSDSKDTAASPPTQTQTATSEHMGDRILGRHKHSPQQPPVADPKRLKPNKSRQTTSEPPGIELDLVKQIVSLEVFAYLVIRRIGQTLRVVFQSLIYVSTSFFKDLQYDETFDEDIRLSEPDNPPSFPNKVPHGPWQRTFKADEFRNNLKRSSSSQHYRSRHSVKSEVSDTDLRDLPMAPWCGTDLVSHPSEWHRQPTQARKGDERHGPVMNMSKHEQWLSTRRVPRLRKKVKREDPALMGEETTWTIKWTGVLPERSTAARLTCLKEMRGGQDMWSPPTRPEFRRFSEFPPSSDNQSDLTIFLCTLC
ncbi:hypothetical protein EMPS_01743 [Entomortierella parvispora]|uniref:Uncharacterized protein n=1 Tax=Entomortierella parvispora TaxID=205924 RepID=A0A9P3LT32_9FUNG|nr:hypothetical protein EMPS_01743 [Entomortierella parvispora]